MLLSVKLQVLLKVTLLHGCFSHFLSGANSTKWRKAPHVFIHANAFQHSAALGWKRLMVRFTHVYLTPFCQKLSTQIAGNYDWFHVGYFEPYLSRTPPQTLLTASKWYVISNYIPLCLIKLKVNLPGMFGEFGNHTSIILKYKKQNLNPLKSDGNKILRFLLF